MKHIDFYLDFISPYAFLAFEKLPESLLGLSYSVSYKPVLFAAMLKHHGQLGPAEIPPKREWTYRQVAWLAHQQGTALTLPAAHPFNPLGLSRLAWACAGEHVATQTPNRYVCESIFHHVWQSGLDAADPQRLLELSERLQPQTDAGSALPKARLKQATDEAIAAQVFGVPSLCVDDKLFWGLDAVPMLRAYLDGDAWFDGPQWRQAALLPVGTARPTAQSAQGRAG